MASSEMLWQQYPLCAVVPFSCNTVQSYLSSPLFHHRQFLDQASLHVLEHDTEDYLSGRKKQELTDWWLQYIEDRVEKYLEEKGYDPSCVPFQYLDHPPASMKRLQENIHVVRAVLSELNIRNSSTQATQTEYELVLPLKQQVYYKVEILRKNLKLVLWDQLNNYGIRVEYHLINDCRDMGFVEQIYLLLEKGVQRVGIPNNIKKGTEIRFHRRFSHLLRANFRLQ